MALEVLRYLLALTLVSSAAIGIAMLIRRPVRRAFGAEASYCTWLLVPVAMGAMLLANAIDTDAARLSYLQIDAVSALSAAVGRSLNSSLESASSFDWPTWLTGAWCLGAALFSVYLAGLQRAYLRSLGTLAGSRGVLRATASSGCPALVGVFRPRIILPVDFETRYTSQERLLVLAHEYVHLRRGDALWNALVALLRCVFWFNPLAHLVASCIRVDQELACDAAVVKRHPTARRTYADAMLKAQLADATLPAGCHWQSAHPLKERLEMLKGNIPGRARRACGKAFVLIASLAVGYTAWAAEPVLTPAPLASSPVAAAKSEPEVQMLSVAKAVLALGPELRVATSADSVRTGPDGTTILEGNVRINATRLSGPQQPARVRRSPDGKSHVAGARWQTMMVTTERAVISPLGNGGVKVAFENGIVTNR